MSQVSKIIVSIALLIALECHAEDNGYIVKCKDRYMLLWPTIIDGRSERAFHGDEGVAITKFVACSAVYSPGNTKVPAKELNGTQYSYITFDHDECVFPITVEIPYCRSIVEDKNCYNQKLENVSCKHEEDGNAPQPFSITPRFDDCLSYSSSLVNGFSLQDKHYEWLSSVCPQNDFVGAEMLELKRK